jgi:hypothetical protein
VADVFPIASTSLQKSPDDRPDRTFLKIVKTDIAMAPQLHKEVENMPVASSLKFAHTTKTGGSTIVELGKQFNIPWGNRDQEYKTSFSGDLQRYDFQHVPAMYMNPGRLLELCETFDFFVVVRNVLDRVVSEFHCRWGGYRSNWNGYEIIRGVYKDVWVKKIDSRVDWNNPVVANAWILRRLQALKMYLRMSRTVRGHWLPQYLYTIDENNKPFVPEDNILRFESFATDVERLMSRYNIPITRQMIEATQHNKRDARATFGVGDLSLEVVSLALEVYREDFRRFYPEELEKLEWILSRAT